MTYGGDVEGVVVVVEAEPIIADAQAELWRFDALEALYVALSGGGEVGESLKNTQGGGLVDGAKLGNRWS